MAAFVWVVLGAVVAFAAGLIAARYGAKLVAAEPTALKDVLEFLNGLETRVWGVVLILGGIVLHIVHQPAAGMSVITAGATVFTPKKSE